MKSVICLVFLLTVFVALSIASVSYGQFNDPKYPGKCTIKDIVLSAGEEAKYPDDKICGRIICGKDSYAEIQTCGAEGVIDGCKLGDYVDSSLPYPDCCKRDIICE